VANTINVDPET